MTWSSPTAASGRPSSLTTSPRQARACWSGSSPTTSARSRRNFPTGRTHRWRVRLRARREGRTLPERTIYCVITFTKDDKVAFLGTTLLDPEQYPAAELITLYRERWEIELAFDEIKNHLGPGGPIRSRTPEGVRQELWAYLAVHHAIRRFAHTAALAGPAVESDRVSYLKCVRIIRRSVPSQLGATTAGLARSLTEAGQEARSRLLPIRRKRTSPRAIKKLDRWPVLRTRAKRGAVEPGRWALNQTKKAKSNRRAGRPVLKPPPPPSPP
ncbi:transposase [Streptomyces prasinus]|uniref:transposase n=1 Tax=Streptomyces prasinus TaxID=67345 RepID=UPI0033A294E6